MVMLTKIGYRADPHYQNPGRRQWSRIVLQRDKHIYHWDEYRYAADLCLLPGWYNQAWKEKLSRSLHQSGRSLSYQFPGQGHRDRNYFFSGIPHAHAAIFAGLYQVPNLYVVLPVSLFPTFLLLKPEE